jgi:peptide/nickel transport system ATP-binding protein
MLAMAMANNPTLLIADEPTTALDRLVQSQVLQLLSSLVEKTGTGLLFISHDLAVVQQVAQRVMVMKDGVVVESGETAQVLSSPSHPYTQQLLRASNLNPSWQGIGGGARATSSDPVIVVRDLVKDYRRPASLGRKPDPVQALRQVSLTVYPGEQLGIVGESGSGKSTLVKILAGLETPTTGSVKVTGQRQLVFQDPYSSLDPRWKVGRSLAEPLQTPSKSQQAELVAQTLTQVGLEPELVAAYPHQLSGGQRQRVAIGRALIAKPQILLADEPVSALDVTTKAEILELLAMCASEQGLTLVMVSHDLHAVRFLCERLVVMKDGVIVEQGPTAQIWDNPQHPYTQSLKGNYEIDTAQR